MSKFSTIFASTNYVTHRERGIIPGCIPTVHTFVERTLDEVRLLIAKDGYQQVWDDYRNGVIGWNEWLNHAIHKRIPYSPIR